MALQLDHTIVPVRDHVAAARRMAHLFGLDYDGGTWGHFAPLKVNDALTLDFDTSANPHGNHYAFLASDAEFDAILARVKAEGVVFGSGPSRAARVDGEINHRHGGRGFYFECPDGHLWEVITHTYVNGLTGALSGANTGAAAQLACCAAHAYAANLVPRCRNW